MSADARAELLARTQIRSPRKVAVYLALAERDGAACQWCGKEADLTIDHRLPDGGDDLDNLQLLCAACNASKGNRTEEKTVRCQSSLFDQGFTMIPNQVILDTTFSVHAQRVYCLLLYYARQDESCWPGQDGLASVAGVSERTIRSAVRELEGGDLVQSKRRGRGQTNVYVLRVPKSRRLGDKPGDNVEKAESRPERGAALDRNVVPLLVDKEAVEENSGRDLDEILLREAWGKLSPPLPAHRPAYYQKPKVKTAIRNAQKVYDAFEIRKAIENYAAVLSSKDHYWTHRWTFEHFLNRGLDQFVADADPLANFVVAKNTDRHGGQQATPHYQLAQAEAWILETAWRLPLDEGEVAEMLGRRGVEGPDRARLLDLWRSRAEAAA